MGLLNPSMIKKIHCMGVGGIGVSGIAEMLLLKGYAVSGSDVQSNPLTRRLQSLGATIFEGHAADHVLDVDLLVYSSAITPENPEFLAAQNAHVPMVSRGQLLAELMQNHRGIAVTGTHGKTTTTGVAAQLFVNAELDPSYLIGGEIQDQNTTMRLGKGEFFIAEADESDASCLYLSPEILVVTNIEPDHLENYEGDFERLKQTFLDCIHRLPEDGVAILGVDCPVLRTLLPQVSRRTVTFGFDSSADIRACQYAARGLQSTFTVKQVGEVSDRTFTLNLPGQYNVLNALAVVALAQVVGIDDTRLAQTLATFPGMGRRFHALGEWPVAGGNALLFDDYGHHPSAIAVTLSAARDAWPDRRLVLVFQPHRYSRTRDLLSDFIRVLSQPDLLVLLDVYPAGEAPIAGCHGEALADAIRKMEGAKTVFVPELESLPQVLQNTLQANDIVLFQGAGNISAAARRIAGIH